MNEQKLHGVIEHENSDRRTDYLYRISIKALVRNSKGEVLVVKEDGRDWWDLPGGGMDHGENVQSALARELSEEVNLQGEFRYRVIAVEDPGILKIGIWQLRIIFEVIPESESFSPGHDADEIAFLDPQVFQYSDSIVERRIYRYFLIASDLKDFSSTH